VSGNLRASTMGALNLGARILILAVKPNSRSRLRSGLASLLQIASALRIRFVQDRVV
jgi:hypothetical protein